MATQHPFLVAAGDGTIDEEALTKWLRQDYLYAYVGYTKVSGLRSIYIKVPAVDREGWLHYTLIGSIRLLPCPP